MFAVLNQRQTEDDSTKFDVRISMIDIKNETAVDLINDLAVVELVDDEMRGTTHLGKRVTVGSHVELINTLQRVRIVTPLFVHCDRLLVGNREKKCG
jgi:hypothetical protein